MEALKKIQEKLSSLSELAKRAISGTIIVICLTPGIWFGGFPLWLTTLLVSLVGIYEFKKACARNCVHLSWIICIIMTLLLFATYFINSSANIILMWVFITLFISLIYSWNLQNVDLSDSFATAIVLEYIPLCLYCIVLIDKIGHIFIWLPLIAAFGSDMGAYFIGRCLGKHKLAPNLSPGKTIEGAIGGIIFASLLAWIFGKIFVNGSTTLCLIIGLLGAIVAEAGDLSASAIKRNVGIKDYGNILPGMGGILDRFDSVLFAAPVIYFIISMIL